MKTDIAKLLSKEQLISTSNITMFSKHKTEVYQHKTITFRKQNATLYPRIVK